MMTAHDDEDDDNGADGDDDDDDDDQTYMFISDTSLWCFTYTHTDVINDIYQTNCLMIMKFKIHIGYPRLYVGANIELRFIS